MKTHHEVTDYKSSIRPVWCAGCGNFGALSAIYHALTELDIERHKMVDISGIGCAARTPYFLESYKMHTLHGRAGPVATGVQLANPELTVMVTGGDGDGFAIGGGHMPHLARRNVNITYVLIDNHLYGLTKGQASPTSHAGMKTKSTPYGSPDAPVRPLAYMLTYGASYIAQGFAGDPKMCAELIKGGLEHKGFAYVHILSQCPAFNKEETVKYLRGIIRPVPEDHDVTDADAAKQLLDAFGEKQPLGLIYRTERPTLDEHMA
ncbi:MAG: thiamine pyrophosphate-dependent enzyme, partial [Mariprofundaceae bacterium]